MKTSSPVLGHDEATTIRDIRLLLAARPDHEFFSESQAEARQWLAEFNMLKEIPGWAETHGMFAVQDYCPTHWILFRIVRRDPDFNRNGYYVTFTPRSAMSGDEVKSLVAKMAGKVMSDRPEKVSAHEAS